MCWVMPPASPAATSVSRIASSSDVLPWSTWPMIVTTGGRALEVLVGVLELRLGVDLVGRVDDLDLLVELVGEDLDRVVGQRLGERGHLAQLHQLLDDLGDRHAEVLGDVLDRRAGVDPDRVGLEDADVLRRRLRRRCRGGGGRRGAAGGAAGRRGRRRAAAGAALAARGLRVDHDAAHAAGRRRGRARPAARSASGAGGALAVALGRLSPLGSAVGRPRRALGLRRSSAGRAAAPARLCCGAASAGAVGSCGRLAGERAVGRVLVDGRGGGLDLDAGSGSRFSTSAEGMSYCLASSWTRFLAMCG